MIENTIFFKFVNFTRFTIEDSKNNDDVKISTKIGIYLNNILS